MAELNEEKKSFLKKEVSTFFGLVIIFVMLLILLGGAGGYYYVAYQQDKKAEEQGQQATEQPVADEETEKDADTPIASDFGTATCPTTLTTAEITELATWERNTNSFYGYSYYIPGDWSQFVSDSTENVPEEITYHDNDYQAGFQSFEYLLDWKAGAIYHAYDQIATENIQVACNNATLKTTRVPEQPNLYMYEVNFTANAKKHQIFYFYKSAGSASLDSDFGEQFLLLLKTIEFDVPITPTT